MVLSGPGMAQGFPEKASTKLEDYGYIQSRPKGEYHANNQQMAKLLHKAVQLGGGGSGVKVRRARMGIADVRPACLTRVYVLGTVQ